MSSAQETPHSKSDVGSSRSHDHDPRDVEAREALADGREAELDAREAANESARDARKQRYRDILGKAEVRDEQADARDSTAERRDRAASLEEFLSDDRFGDNLQARRSAAIDRAQSKDDRSLAASDRTEMADLEPPDDGPS